MRRGLYLICSLSLTVLAGCSAETAGCLIGVTQIVEGLMAKATGVPGTTCWWLSSQSATNEGALAASQQIPPGMVVTQQREPLGVVEKRLKENGIDIPCARRIASAALGYPVGIGEYPPVDVKTRNEIDKNCKRTVIVVARNANSSGPQ